MVISSRKCHGAFSPLAFESSRNDDGSVCDFLTGRSMDLPHDGHSPAGVKADGAKYREHGSHHGIQRFGASYPCSERVRTRNLIGVEPNSKASRIERSR